MNKCKQKTLAYLKKLFFPYSKRVYFVGGYVRDKFLGIDSDDIDIEVYDIDVETFTLLMQNISASGVGKSFFVYKYKNVDISLPRTETKTSYGHDGFEVAYINNEQIASKRRDFTISSLMQNIYSDEILDFYGGVEDLNNKRIKIVDKKSFIEDSLRVLRGIRFAARFGFRIEQHSLELFKTISLDDLSYERVSNELEMIFKTQYLEYAFYYLYKIGFLKTYLKVSLTNKEFFKIYKIIKKSRQYFQKECYEYYFLYIINSFKEIDFEIIKSLRYKKTILSQKKLDFNIDDRDLYIISLDIPIYQWLGAINQDIIDRAKELGIYKEKLKTDINSYDIIKDGFTKDGIKKEIKRRELKFIDDKIKDNDISME